MPLLVLSGWDRWMQVSFVLPPAARKMVSWPIWLDPKWGGGCWAILLEENEVRCRLSVSCPHQCRFQIYFDIIVVSCSCIYLNKVNIITCTTERKLSVHINATINNKLEHLKQSIQIVHAIFNCEYFVFLKSIPRLLICLFFLTPCLFGNPLLLGTSHFKFSTDLVTTTWEGWSWILIINTWLLL